MDLIKWDDSFSVNVVEIDQQHQELIRMFNRLADAIRKNEGNEILVNTLGDLFNYAEQHFKTEEKYFAQFSYPEEDSHKEEHRKFVLRIVDYKEKLKKAEPPLAKEVLTFMWDWFKNHIKVTDMKYSRFFNENGLK